MVGGGTIWQRTETFTGIIEGHHPEQACRDEKNAWQAARSEKDVQMMSKWRPSVWVPVCVCQRASLIISNSLHLHSEGSGLSEFIVRKKNNKINLNLPSLHTVKCGDDHRESENHLNLPH